MTLLRDITGIRINGGCYSKDGSPTELNNILYAPVNILFGRNGSGKSTLARALDEYAHPDPDNEPEYKVDFIGGTLSENQRKRIFVFNENFVERNVKTRRDGLETIVILGAKDQQRQAEIDELNNLISTKDQRIKDLTTIINNSHDKNNSDSIDYVFESLKKKMKAQGGYADRVRDINKKTTQGQVTDTTITDIAQQFADTATDLNLKQQFEKELMEYLTLKDGTEITWRKPIVEPHFDFDHLNSLMAKKVENPELSEREKYLLQVTKESNHNFVAILQKDLLQQKRTICPLCLRDIDEAHQHNLEEAVSHILNKEVDDHKAELNLVINQIKDVFYTLPSLPIEIYKEDLNEAQSSIEKLNHALSILRQRLQEKYESPLSPITDDNLKFTLDTAYHNITTSFTKLEEDVNDYNARIKAKNKKKDELLKKNLQLAWIEHSVEINEYLSRKQQLENNLQEKEQLEKEYETLQTRIVSLNSQESDASQAVNIINTSLRTIFSDKKRMQIEYDDEKNCYLLKAHGKSVKPNRISEGERNIIGLSYFFASLNADKEVGTQYDIPILLVIDDPISSYDYNNKIGVISFINSQIEAMMSKNVNSKVILMSHDMQTIQRLSSLYVSVIRGHFNNEEYDTNKPTIYEIDKGQLKILDDTSQTSTYEKLLRQIYKYATSESANDVEDLAIGNELRRVLETYCSFNYKDGIYRMKALAEHAYYPGSSNEEKSIKIGNYSNFILKSFFDSESHQTPILPDTHFDCEASYDEKRDAAKHTLMLLYHIDKYHIKRYLYGSQSNQIEEWCKTDHEW